MGKSALTLQITENRFAKEYNPGVENYFTSHRYIIQNDIYTFEILDTGTGSSSFAMRDLMFRRGEGFIILYDITSQSSFNNVEHWREQIIEIKENVKTPIILVGNKSDLEDERMVTEEEGRNKAKNYECPFFEISAKSRDNIEEILEELVKISKRQARNVKYCTVQ